ncbi:thioredoxin family protein [Capnocytophaga sp. G2]|uniref:thioredoxin family protein n=1 Tax=Capnocytophaga sp. G2 TaxID=3110695 RepID=UPI002B492EEB|nr:thioredoxin family protein [Capnocytophaga sp. G2]MEB3005288.1 thioredoxin family protein [Capnocytophaga sp. G2]
MKKYILLFLIILGHSVVFSQNKTTEVIQEKMSLPKPYDPMEDGDTRITELLVQAKKENKKLLIQIGGNWCIWCLRFNHLVTTDPELKAILNKKYVYYHLNYSPENKNERAFAKYGNPGEKYGYPAFLILDKRGNILSIRKTEDMEEGKGYNKTKVKKFLQGRLD